MILFQKTTNTPLPTKPTQTKQNNNNNMQIITDLFASNLVWWLAPLNSTFWYQFEWPWPELSFRTTWHTTCCTRWVPDELHVICTQLCSGHLNVRAGDSLRCSEETVEFHLSKCDHCHYYFDPVKVSIAEHVYMQKRAITIVCWCNFLVLLSMYLNSSVFKAYQSHIIIRDVEDGVVRLFLLVGIHGVHVVEPTGVQRWTQGYQYLCYV